MEKLVQSVVRLMKTIFGGERRPYSQSKQNELAKAYKTIRMAQNYGESYQAVKARIRIETARYKQFKRTPNQGSRPIASGWIPGRSGKSSMKQRVGMNGQPALVLAGDSQVSGIS